MEIIFNTVRWADCPGIAETTLEGSSLKHVLGHYQSKVGANNSDWWKVGQIIL